MWGCEFNVDNCYILLSSCICILFLWNCKCLVNITFSSCLIEIFLFPGFFFFATINDIVMKVCA